LSPRPFCGWHQQNIDRSENLLVLHNAQVTFVDGLVDIALPHTTSDEFYKTVKNCAPGWLTRAGYLFHCVCNSSLILHVYFLFETGWFECDDCSARLRYSPPSRPFSCSRVDPTSVLLLINGFGHTSVYHGVLDDYFSWWAHLSSLVGCDRLFNGDAAAAFNAGSSTGASHSRSAHSFRHAPLCNVSAVSLNELEQRSIYTLLDQLLFGAPLVSTNAMALRQPTASTGASCYSRVLIGSPRAMEPHGSDVCKL
jgi:hypothetical protein